MILNVDTNRIILGRTFLQAFEIDFAKRTSDGWISIPKFSLNYISSIVAGVVGIETFFLRYLIAKVIL